MKKMLFDLFIKLTLFILQYFYASCLQLNNENKQFTENKLENSLNEDAKSLLYLNESTKNYENVPTNGIVNLKEGISNTYIDNNINNNVEDDDYIYEQNYSKRDPRYKNKKVCRTSLTWKDISLSWTQLRRQLPDNCTYISGNLIISGLDEDDDLGVLEHIQEISGYLVIHGNGLSNLVLPHLKVIKGNEYVSFRSRKVSLLVVSNYRPNSRSITNKFSSTLCEQTKTCSKDHVKYQSNDLNHLQILAMPSLISVVQYGIYFYDNPGLCYAPFTLKWDEMIESTELQTVDLIGVHSESSLQLWHQYCQCKYLKICNNIEGSDTQGVSIQTTNNIISSQNTEREEVEKLWAEKFNNVELNKREIVTIKNNSNQNGKQNSLFGINDSNVSQELNNLINESSQIMNKAVRSETILKLSTALLNKSSNFTYMNDNHHTELKNSANSNLQSIQDTDINNFRSFETFIKNENSKIGSNQNLFITIPSQHTHTVSTTDSTILKKSLQVGELGTEAAVTQPEQITDSGIKLNTNIEHGGNENSENKQFTYNSDDINPFNLLMTTMAKDISNPTSMTTSTNEKAHSEQILNTSSLKSRISPETLIGSMSLTLGLSNPNDKAINETKILVSSSLTYGNLSLPCHIACPVIQGKRYCWGPGPDQCQMAHKCQLRLCDGSNWCFRTLSNIHDQSNRPSLANRNSFPKPGYFKEICCHSECAAGCNGPKANECRACLRFSYNGVCINACPASKIYDKSTYTWRENPHGLLTYGSLCVKSCPKTFIQDDDHCVSKCSRPGFYAQHGKCIPCPNSVCPKICTIDSIEPIKGVDYLHRSSLKAMENCTVFEGDLKLSMQSFIGDQFYNLSQADEGVRWSDLMIGLSHLEQITGTLYISAGKHAPWMTNLTFLSNLKTIDGTNAQNHNNRIININWNEHLEFLGLLSLEKLGHPNLLITGNPRLCYMDKLNWLSFVNNMTAKNETSLIRSNNAFMMKKVYTQRNTETVINNDLFLKHFLKNTNFNSYKTKKAVKESNMFIGGNAHPEFCKGKGAICDELCDPELGCWGPGNRFCLSCRSWTIRPEGGGKLCVNDCQEIPGYYFLPNKIAGNQDNLIKISKYNDISSDTIKSMNKIDINSNKDIKEEKVLHTTVTNHFTTINNDSINVNSKQDYSEEYNDTNKINANLIKKSMDCLKCSPMCTLQKQTCYGPEANECNGPCRWVKDGPFCREKCPPQKYVEPDTRRCLECADVCSAPVSLLEGFSHPNSPMVNTKTDLNSWNAYCTGPGNWPGYGGCNLCKRTVLHKGRQQKSHHLECVNTCPFGTYLHVINLHHRGGSSIDVTNFKQNLNFVSIHANDASSNQFYTEHSWSLTDATLFDHMDIEIKKELFKWLVNHTQPYYYGLAQVCLPCHEQCHPEPLPIPTQSNQLEIPVACYGPSPEQCVRCANVSYQGRCVSACPPGTYASRKWLKQVSNSKPMSSKEKTQIFDYTTKSPQIDSSTFTNKSSADWYECLPCNKQCLDWCFGPTTRDCKRCKGVKIYLTKQMDSWVCNHSCPTINKYALKDLITDELICSSKPDHIEINPIIDLEYHRYLMHDIKYNNSDEDLKQNQNVKENNKYEEHDSEDGQNNYDQLEQLISNSHLSSESAGYLASGLVALVMLVTLIWIICWTVNEREKYDKIDNYLNQKYDVTNHSCTKSLCKMCETLWTQGRSRELKEKQQKYSRNKLLKPSIWKSPNSISCLSSPDKQENETDNSDEKKLLLMAPETVRPNMAVLRIISESELIRGPLIGSGAFGTVYCGIWRPKFGLNQGNSISHLTDQLCGQAEHSTTHVDIPVAIKVLSDSADPETNKQLLEEAKVMATVDHPCCVRFLALCLTSNLQLITQFMPLGSLLECIKNRWEAVEVCTLMHWAEQIANGMAHLASRGIIHRDLAARNVLVQSKDQVLITDFGLAKCLDTIESEYKATGGRMPIKWLAIECIQDRIFSSKSDVWAYGVTLWEMFTLGQKPYEQIRAKDILEFLERGNRLPHPETISLDLYCLLLSCWQTDPGERPTFNELGQIIHEMNQNPHQHLFSIPELLKPKSEYLQNSQSALEFLSSYMTSGTSQDNLDDALKYNRPHDPILSEYTQMQARWIRNLYVNSRSGKFPGCIQDLFDNYYSYLDDIKLADYFNSNHFVRSEDYTLNIPEIYTNIDDTSVGITQTNDRNLVINSEQPSETNQHKQNDQIDAYQQNQTGYLEIPPIPSTYLNKACKAKCSLICNDRTMEGNADFQNFSGSSLHESQNELLNVYQYLILNPNEMRTYLNWKSQYSMTSSHIPNSQINKTIRRANHPSNFDKCLESQTEDQSCSAINLPLESKFHILFNESENLDNE